MSRVRDIANNNGGFKRGNSAGRPSPATVGDIYFNSSNNALEIYLSTGWTTIQYKLPATYTYSSMPTSFVVGDVITVPYSGVANQIFSTLNATSIKFDCYGASGSNSYSAAAKGGYSYGNLSVSNNETLYLNVGGQGGARVDYAYQAASSPFVNTGGFNGGGNGGGSYDSRNNQLRAVGPGGGGATDVRRSGTALSNRIIVAGGGGVGWRSAGGTGGGTSGGNGIQYPDQMADFGNGGTQSAGGANSSNSAANGTLGLGGNGVNLTGGDYVGNNPGPGAGGGGGYYGGAGLVGSQAWGGNSSGSGGGSGFIGGVTSAGMTNGGQPSVGNGSMTITILAIG